MRLNYNEHHNTMKKIPALIIISSLFLSPSCVHNRKAINNYSLVLAVREGLGVSRAEADDIFRQYFKSGDGGDSAVEVIIFSYSSGKESFFYSGDSGEGIKSDTDDGSIEALVKIRERGKIVGAEFFKARGRSREELLKNIAAEIISSSP